MDTLPLPSIRGCSSSGLLSPHSPRGSGVKGITAQNRGDNPPLFPNNPWLSFNNHPYENIINSYNHGKENNNKRNKSP